MLKANWLLTDASAGWLMTELKAQGSRGTTLKSQSVVTDGNWHHVGLAWDGTNRILYVDDAEVARDTQPSLPISGTGLYMGAGSKLSKGTFWSGLIDDVRIYSRVGEAITLAAQLPCSKSIQRITQRAESFSALSYNGTGVLCRTLA